MKVFLSWSDDKSRMVAEALRDWLPAVIQEIVPFMSEKDIAAGARWTNQIEQELEGTQLGIVCVTRENQSAPWLNFEAGAIAKQIESSRRCASSDRPKADRHHPAARGSFKPKMPPSQAYSS
jgi:hypothetical protein